MQGTNHTVPVVVIGAGQAGLSASYFLRRHGVPFVVLDHGKRPGGAWQYRWPTLRFSQVHGLYQLPGMTLRAPQDDFPASEVVSAYFEQYERLFDLPVHRPVDVTAVRYDQHNNFLVESAAETWTAQALINATGTWDRPFWPHYPGQETFAGEQLHVADYEGPQAFHGKRVLVVGGGTSAMHVLLEVAPVAANITWVTRRPPIFHEGPFTTEHGRAAVARVDAAVRAGRPPESVVSVTGLMLTPDIVEARQAGVLNRQPMFDRIRPRGVVWANGQSQDVDVILWATGFRAALDHLAPLRLREPGGGITMDGTEVVREPRLHLIGYGPSASTIGANRAGRHAVSAIRKLLG